MKNNLLSFVITALVLLTGCSSSRKSEPFRGPLKNTSAEVVDGEKVFMKHCNKCHPMGEAGLGPALNDKRFLPSFLMKFQIRNGLGTMPSFSDKEISSEELDNLIAYMKELRSK